MKFEHDFDNLKKDIEGAMRIHYILEISPLFQRFVQIISIFLKLSKLCSNLMISEQKMSFSPFFSKNMDSTGLPK